MDDTPAPRRAPAAWIEAIEQARAEVAAGQTYDFDEVIAAFEREDEAEIAATKASRPKLRRRTAEA
jgi:hypothetical protein